MSLGVRRPLQAHSKTYEVTRKPSASSWRYARARELEMPTQYMLPHCRGHQLCYRLVTICKHLPICESNSILTNTIHYRHKGTQRQLRTQLEMYQARTIPTYSLHFVIVYLHETRKIQRMKLAATIIGVSDSLQSPFSPLPPLSL
jgi:hypothetical protein